MTIAKPPQLLWWDGTNPYDYEPDRATIDLSTGLTQLADVFGSDKGSLGNAHAYTNVYERIITPSNTTALCEIGVACGASLKMWSTYLPDARILGLDVREECKQLCKDYVNVEIVIDNVLDLRYDHDFDVVIDDSSHIAEDIAKFFEHCWSWVKDGGLYIVEDLACTYSQEYLDEYNTRFGQMKRNERGMIL